MQSVRRGTAWPGKVRWERNRIERRSHVRAVRTGHADPRVRAARLAVTGGQGTGHRRGARPPGHPVLPAAQRADRPAGGARLRSGAGQAPARPARPATAHPVAPLEGPVGVTRPPRAATPEGQAGLDALISRPRQALIGTDFDGTLAPIVADPRAARALPGAVPALRRLARAVGTLAVITGRPAAEAVAYGGLDAVPGLIVLGHYGWQRWQDGEVSGPDSPPAVQAARQALPDVLSNAPDGTWVEDKGHALAVHTRRTADPEGAFRLLRTPLEDLAERLGLAAEPGRMVIELRPPGVDKGTA